MTEDLKQTKNASLLRKTRNADVLKRMKEGEALNSFDSNSSWFPPRPNVEKDETAVKKLYGKGTKVLSGKKDEEKKKKQKDALKASNEITEINEFRDAAEKEEADSTKPTQDAS